MAAWCQSDQVKRGHTTRDAVLILGAVSTPSPPPSRHLLRCGSRGGRGGEGLHVPEWGRHQEMNQKRPQSHGWRTAFLPGSSPALGSHISALLAKMLSPRYLLMLEFASHPIEDQIAQILNLSLSGLFLSLFLRPRLVTRQTHGRGVPQGPSQWLS